MNNAHIRRFIGTPEAVILADGDYPQHPLPLHYLDSVPVIACCDGAANAHIAKGRRPSLIIGDGDSVLPEHRAAYADILYIEREQESNDLSKAVALLVSRNIRNILILGATGKREDHTLANISLLMNYHRRQIRTLMLTDYGLFAPFSNIARWQSPVGSRVSVFNFGAKNLVSRGLEYPLYDLEEWWQGTLNTTSAPEAEVSADGDFLLYFALGGR
ncbi:thiamine diphosphokinase [Neisseria chenwenguii]|uniref:Thiamine diphosphokinase n=2 Tax=Neisseria chenwenguii TaxID=1853278 RepID=A0A220S519_9NEIS|nr:thiamine diphosphokinase [Neisseria chenwenguii]ROV56654.1 thiamine diphosphokinase [Neisseria chenwenguii]